MAKRSPKSRKPKSTGEEESEKQHDDPFRGSESVTLEELLDDIFEEELEE